MNLISFSPQFEKMRNFMLDIEKHFEPISYVAQSVLNSTAYPPHNIYKKDNKHIIEMAVAGFDKDNLSIEIEPNILTVLGETREQEDAPSCTYRGIAARKFTRVFYLSEYMKVINASLKNGILKIEIEKIIPEAEKPKQITIE